MPDRCCPTHRHEGRRKGREGKSKRFTRTESTLHTSIPLFRMCMVQRRIGTVLILPFVPHVRMCHSARASIS